jgi:adenylate cyclase
MADLIAQGPRATDRWRRALPANQTFLLGRDAGPWSVPWEAFLSRQHATLTWRDGRLHVVNKGGAINPIYVEGEPLTEFAIKPGEHFAIGDTTFSVVSPPAETLAGEGMLIQERVFSARDVQQFQVRDAAHHLDVLGRLPETISRAANDQQLFTGLAHLLLDGIPRSDAVALVEVDRDAKGDSAVQVLHWDRRNVLQGRFQPSSQLILDAHRRKETVMKIWAGEQADPYTQAADLDWAFCTPLRGESSQGWAIYVAGQFARDLASTVMVETEATGLGDDLKFTELLAEIWRSLRQVNQLKQRQTTLSQFFSPAVVRSLAEADPELVLKPQITEVTVLFCDLRGSSREAEKHADDLLGLLEHIRKTLGLMTMNIFDQEGVIADFQGDAAMAFWGWPKVHPDRIQRACLAALGIQTLFTALANRPQSKMPHFKVGIGIATGSAVVGKIGSTDQVKVGVFGPVVNLASRLEAMTKTFHVPILVDETTHRLVEKTVSTDLVRVRRLMVVKPYGMETVLTVSELLPPLAEYPLLTDQHLADYEAALDALRAGEWSRAYELVHGLPAQDRGKDFLTALVLQHNHTPPTGWNGWINLNRP